MQHPESVAEKQKKVILALDDEYRMSKRGEIICIDISHPQLQGTVSDEILKRFLKQLEFEESLLENIDLKETNGIRKYYISIENESYLLEWANEIRNEEKMPFRPKTKDFLHCGQLTVSLRNGNIYITDHPAVNISITNLSIRFLILLLRSPETIIYFKEIAEHLDINTYSDGDTGNEQATRDRIKTIKNDLFSYLKDQGMDSISVSKIQSMITSARGLGYKLIPLD